MKKFKTATVVLLAGLLALGCAATAADEGKDGTGAAPGNPDPRLICLEGELELTPAIEEWVELLHPVEGVYVRRDGEYQHVLVAMGERPTGGYRVELNDAMEADACVLLEVAYRQPGPGEFVIQVLTYPYLLVSVRTAKEIRVQLVDDAGAAVPLPVHDSGAAEVSELITVRLPLPFQGVGDTIRLAGRVKTDLPAYAYVEDGHNVLLDETELELAAGSDGWRQFDQEFSLGRASSPYGMLEIWFGTGEGRVRTAIPVRMVNWSYENK